MKTEKKIEKPMVEAPKMRQIIIETDGNRVRVTKNEAASLLEFKAILTTLIAGLQ